MSEASSDADQTLAGSHGVEPRLAAIDAWLADHPAAVTERSPGQPRP